jgi:hypothetical protein
MLIIGDARLPAEAIKNLSAFGTFVPFATRSITYEAVSGHPDLFFCQHQQQVVVAPNVPKQYLTTLQNHGISFVKGKLPVGKLYPQTSRYNAVVTSNFLIHNTKHSDPSLKQAFAEKECIPVNQGYTRCNLLVLDDDLFITSDSGIFNQLQKQHLDVHYSSPEAILLPGFEHGFLGGCLGVFENQVFVAGSFSRFPEGEKLSLLLESRNYKIVELYDGPLFDGGSLFFF